VYYADNSRICFLFLLTLNKKYNLKSDRKQYAIFNHSPYGPVFGYGFDLILWSDCDKNSSSYADIGDTYESESCSAFTGGSNEHFSVVEYEVYGVA